MAFEASDTQTAPSLQAPPVTITCHGCGAVIAARATRTLAGILAESRCPGCTPGGGATPRPGNRMLWIR